VVDDVALAAIPHTRSVERDGQGRVIKLDCGRNDFDTLPPEVCTLTRLRELDLHFCSSLTTLPPELGDLTNLEELRMSYCSQLKRLPPEIGQLWNLRVLRLGSCPSLMSLPPEISNLSSLEHVTLPPGINVVEFMEQGGMEGWTSMRRFCLSKDWQLSDNEYPRFFRHLPSWLVELQLRDNIDSVDLLSRAQLPPKLRVLLLWSFGRIMNLPNESDKQSLVDLLRRNRYLGFICSDFYRQKLYSPLAEHFLDINESGRCLIEGGGCPIPLSVWSIVLERVNQKLTRRDTQDDEDHKLCRRANVIYCLLHGPAFAARETLN
jgi:Leucine-rich repeat (LRR) protein